MRAILLAFIITSITTPAYCQRERESNTANRNTFFFEAGGNTFLYSLNYDRLLKIKNSYRLSGRTGIMYFNSFSKDDINLAGIPIEFSYLKGKGSTFFEFGLGVAGVYFYRKNYHQGQLMDTDETFLLMSSIRFGFRHQKNEGGLFYKIGFTPIASFGYDLSQTDPNPDNKSLRIFPWAGAAIGWTLKVKP